MHSISQSVRFGPPDIVVSGQQYVAVPGLQEHRSITCAFTDLLIVAPRRSPYVQRSLFEAVGLHRFKAAGIPIEEIIRFQSQTRASVPPADSGDHVIEIMDELAECRQRAMAERLGDG